jgi:hypothetical protein
MPIFKALKFYCELTLGRLEVDLLDRVTMLTHCITGTR